MEVPSPPTLAAAIINGKYVNAIPLYRLEQEFRRYGLAITRQNMANWMIRLGEEYLSVLYDYLHRKLYDYHVIQADETPVLVNHDGRPAGSKSYMWVYRSGYMYPEKQIVLYEYQRTRNASHPREFLKDFSGICVTDGYQVYHTLEKEKEDLTIAGCWVHGRRKFEEVLATIPAEGKKGIRRISGHEADPGNLPGRGKTKRSLFERKTCAASGGHPATGRCFVRVPETEKRSDRGKRKTESCLYLPSESGKISPGISE